jgi:CheY-like chemotaxis protein
MALILVLGLDGGQLREEAPVLLRDEPGLQQTTSFRELAERLTLEGGRLAILGPELAEPPMPEVVRRLRALPTTRHVSILALLAEGVDAETEQAVRDAGANAVLRRPVERPVLDAWITKLLDVPRRVEARIPVHGQVLGSPRGAGSAHFYGLSRNVSVNGMLLASPVRLEEGPDLDLELHVPETTERVRALGRVVRDASEVGWPYLGYGVEFLFVPPESLRALAVLVSRTAGEGAAERIHATVRRGSWIYELREPVRYEAGYLVEIRRGRRDGWRPGLSGPFYVVEGPSPPSALQAARDFLRRLP